MYFQHGLWMCLWFTPEVIFMLNCCIDDGGGMSPDKIRHCMSLGYSAKSKVKNTIGQCMYGRGTFQQQYIQLLWIYIFFFGMFIKIQEIQFAFNCTSADGNGFKTSTMRLGADILVFSRSHSNEERRLFSVILITANCTNHKLSVTIFDISTLPV